MPLLREREADLEGALEQEGLGGGEVRPDAVGHEALHAGGQPVRPQRPQN